MRRRIDPHLHPVPHPPLPLAFSSSPPVTFPPHVSVPTQTVYGSPAGPHQLEVKQLVITGIILVLSAGRTFDSGSLHTKCQCVPVGNLCAFLLTGNACVRARTCKCDVVSTTNAHPHLHAGIPGDDRTSFIITSSQKVILVFYAQSFLPLFIGYFTHQRTRGWGARTQTHIHTPMLRARRRE